MIALDAILYAFVCGAMLMLSALGLESAIVVPSLDRWSKRFFSAFFAFLAVSSSTFFLELAAYMNPAWGFLEAIACCIQSLLYSIPFPLLVVYLLHCCGEDWRDSLLFRAVAASWLVYFILLGVAQFTTFFYYITPEARMGFGPAYPVLVAPLPVMLLLVVEGVARRKGKLPRQYYRAFLVCLLPVAVVVIIHMFIPVFLLVSASLAISAFSMYRIIEAESVEWDRRQQRQISNQRASIAVLQMRPHFIYNTMTSIYYLCDQNPSVAKRVTMDFTAYLRKNFTAIAGEDVIPFSEELEHARAYLAVEQAQYEDDLLVVYDTPHTRFRLPPLTLQPIVENSVKHGMDLDSGPLHIRICSRETDSGSEVIVEDDGCGFGPADDGKTHTALANIEERLGMMCGGRLAIAPREGGGTVVKVTIPQRG